MTNTYADDSQHMTVLESDGSYLANSASAGYGFIIRNETNASIFGGPCKASNEAMAQGIALLEGINEALCCSISRILIPLDA